MCWRLHFVSSRRHYSNRVSVPCFDPILSQPFTVEMRLLQLALPTIVVVLGVSLPDEWQHFDPTTLEPPDSHSPDARFVLAQDLTSSLKHVVEAFLYLRVRVTYDQGPRIGAMVETGRGFSMSILAFQSSHDSKGIFELVSTPSQDAQREYDAIKSAILGDLEPARRIYYSAFLPSTAFFVPDISSDEEQTRGVTDGFREVVQQFYKHFKGHDSALQVLEEHTGPFEDPPEVALLLSKLILLEQEPYSAMHSIVQQYVTPIAVDLESVESLSNDMFSLYESSVVVQTRNTLWTRIRMRALRVLSHALFWTQREDISSVIDDEQVKSLTNELLTHFLYAKMDPHAAGAAASCLVRLTRSEIAREVLIPKRKEISVIIEFARSRKDELETQALSLYIALSEKYEV